MPLRPAPGGGLRGVGEQRHRGDERDGRVRRAEHAQDLDDRGQARAGAPVLRADGRGQQARRVDLLDALVRERALAVVLLGAAASRAATSGSRSRASGGRSVTAV
jgi:hypothetical protein